MLDQALRHYWHPVAVSSDVTTEPQQVRLLGEPIVLYRDDEGLVALRDKCVHRGAAMSRGCIRDGQLMCPYHGWEYDRTGAVSFIPALGHDG
ncbi:MAG: Rieske (2Fe-2S) protein, partial [Acidimicrobiia bacterium]|nr:Rieske (2Fe-2S) protein [Acidimicrobiia bacterium]